MFLDKWEMINFGDFYDVVELRFLDFICLFVKVFIQGYDKYRNVIYWNDLSEEIYGFFCEEVIGKKFEELIIFLFMWNEVLILY